MDAELQHKIADLDRRVGKLKRTIEEESKLLTDALAAARKGKTHVVIDHLERVLESFKRVL